MEEAPVIQVPAQEEQVPAQEEQVPAGEPAAASPAAEGAVTTEGEGPIVLEGSPVYIPATQIQVDSSHALRSGDPSFSAEEPSRDRVDLLVAAAHASTDFSATHEPAPVIRAREQIDLMEVFVLPLRTFLAGLRFSIDTSLSQFKQRMASNKIKSFKQDILEVLQHIDSADDLKEFVEMLRDEVKSVQSKGVDVTGFSEIAELLGAFQMRWAVAEGEIQPQPPHTQIAAVEESIRVLRGRLMQWKDAVSTDEDTLRSLARDEVETHSELSEREAQLSELEMIIRSLREKLAAIRATKGTTSRRVESHKGDISNGEQELKTLGSESKILRSSTVEASAEAKQDYESVLRTMQLLLADFVSCMERLESS